MGPGACSVGKTGLGRGEGLGEASWYPGFRGTGSGREPRIFPQRVHPKTSPLHLPQLVGVRACVCTRMCTHGHVCVTVRWVRGDRLSLPIRKRGETWYPPKPEMPWK